MRKQGWGDYFRAHIHHRFRHAHHVTRNRHPGLGSQGRGRECKLMGAIWNMESVSNRPKRGDAEGKRIMMVLTKFIWYCQVLFLLCTIILAGLFEIQLNMNTHYIHVVTFRLFSSCFLRDASFRPSTGDRLKLIGCRRHTAILMHVTRISVIGMT